MDHLLSMEYRISISSYSKLRMFCLVLRDHFYDVSKEIVL